MLARFERERFDTPLLREIRARLDTEGVPPSKRIARLQRYEELLDWRENQFFAPLAAAVLWTTQLAFAIERWRKITGPHVAEWLRAMGELEALCAFSGYACEHPDDPFPELIDAGAWFEGEGLGHPLLPADRLVRNDVCLGGETRVLIVSGSNMSGKSTLLRTVGVNAVLALAGAPVRASRLRVSPLTVGASLRVHESLQEGRSRFYGEILRLRQLVELGSGPRPLLFLLDEVLHGTNSHDRQIGATAIVRGFVDRGAIGLVTTHDLALAAMADTLGGRAANVHFEDRLVDGTMIFDYRMKPGVVRSSNALALMRAVGLDVPPLRRILLARFRDARHQTEADEDERANRNPRRADTRERRAIGQRTHDDERADDVDDEIGHTVEVSCRVCSRESGTPSAPTADMSTDCTSRLANR